jgi:glucose-1-phosphatase
VERGAPDGGDGAVSRWEHSGGETAWFHSEDDSCTGHHAGSVETRTLTSSAIADRSGPGAAPTLRTTLPCMSDRDVDFVLFDLGGVLIELGGVATLQEMAGIASDEEVWHRWLASPWVRRFERGECSSVEFSIGVVSERGLAIAPERFLAIFRDWPIGPFPGSSELLTEVQSSVPIGCLSNTNAMHWDHQTSQWPLLGMFDFKFLSFEMGLVKPDPDIFDAVASQLPVGRDRVLYLDDIARNSDAARSFGFFSEQVRGVREARQVLIDVGILTA